MNAHNRSKYHNLEVKLENNYTKNNEFYFYNDGLIKLTDWKLHISVSPKDISKAYDLISDILEKNFHSFKVITPDVINGRLFHGAQFTVYLSQEYENQLDKLKKIIKQIEKILKDNDIAKGEIPRSDASINETTYFSLRNDGACTFKAERIKSNYYLTADTVGRHYNPLNAPNPYQSLLDKKDEPFDLMDYFNKFEVNSIYGLSQAIAFSCLAFCNYRKKMNKSKTDTFGLGIFFSPSSEDDVRHSIKYFEKKDYFAQAMADAFWGMPDLQTMDMLKTISLQTLYPFDDEIRSFLIYVDKIKMNLPLFNDQAHQPRYFGPWGIATQKKLEKALENIQLVLKLQLMPDPLSKDTPSSQLEQHSHEEETEKLLLQQKIINEEEEKEVKKSNSQESSFVEKKTRTDSNKMLSSKGVRNIFDEKKQPSNLIQNNNGSYFNEMKNSFDNENKKLPAYLLCEAIHNNDLDKVDDILNIYSVSELQTRIQLGTYHPCLHVAVEEGNESIVKILVQKGFNVNLKDPNEGLRTVLSIAAEKGHTNIINFLIENKADTSLKDNYDKTPMEWAPQLKKKV